MNLKLDLVCNPIVILSFSLSLSPPPPFHSLLSGYIVSYTRTLVVKTECGGLPHKPLANCTASC